MASSGGTLRSMEFVAEGGVRRAFENSPDGVLILDFAGIVQFANSAAATLLGADAVRPGASWFLQWAAPDRAAARVGVEAAAGGETRRFSAPIAKSAGGLRYLDTVVSPLRDEAGAPIAVLVTSRDVTELEEARLAAEARERVASHEASVLRAVADMVYLGSWEMDFRRNVTRVAGAGVQAMRGGPEHGELDSEASFEMFRAEDAARIQGMIERACRTGESFRYDAQIKRHDGTLGWVREFGEPIYEEGVCVGIRGAGMDISDEVASREAVERAERRLKLAAQLAGMEVFELDFDRQSLLPSSPQADEDVSRYSDLWPNPLHIVDPRDQARVRAEWERAVATQGPFRCEFRIHREGEEAWIYCVAEVVPEEEQPRRVVVATMDITERKRHELEILQTMGQMREHEARQKLLLDELNHRVKNTLASVQSVAVQTLAGARELHEARDLFIERLMALSSTHDLLVKHAWTSASFRELVEVTLRPYGNDWRYAGPDLRLDPNYAVSLGMAVHELATNAIKHGAWRNGGHVDITTAVEGGQVRIVWRESGGPPVSPPTRGGFGARLLQRGVAAELGGKVVLDYAPDGLACTIQAPTSARLRLAPHDSEKSRLTV
ncbi:PAS domain-containing protein [Phenylobacterium sp. LjRoot219]|uniref:HWE histidine kinase domain-containing protein n=1 Tax=Phenylobacterium sp. LjRoot219 TaxID=3342283 RepID=UPI003ECEBFCC